MRWLLLLLWIVMIAGCDMLDTAVERVPDGDPMGTDSVAVRAVYFPASLGQTWQYVYRHTTEDEVFGNREVIEGNLTWTISDSLPVAHQTQWRIQERFEGIKTQTRGDGQRTEEPVTWERTSTALLGEERLELGVYTDRLPTVQWTYPDVTADTVRVDTLLAAGFGRTTSKHLTLVRDVGIVRWWSGTAGRGANFEEFYLDDNATSAAPMITPKL